MPSYIGSTYDFAVANLVQIYGVKEANIERKTTEHLPDGMEAYAGQIVSQTPEPMATLNLEKTRIVLTVYEPKTEPSSSSSKAQVLQKRQAVLLRSIILEQKHLPHPQTETTS